MFISVNFVRKVFVLDVLLMMHTLLISMRLMVPKTATKFIYKQYQEFIYNLNYDA